MFTTKYFCLIKKIKGSVCPLPQLSIVVAVFNGEKFLPQFFNCLHAQQLENWELILVDDGSTDNSRQIYKWKNTFPMSLF
ncbi:glycosyltransferase [Proteus mirabilis]